MKMKSTEGKLLAGSVTGFLVMSMSLLLMPFQKLGFLPGIIFWAGLLSGVIGQGLLARTLRKSQSKAKGGRWGLLTFCANPWAKLADVSLLASLLAAFLTIKLCPAAYICYVTLAAVAFCFCLHCIFNGRVFGCVVGHDRSRQKPEYNNQREKGDGTR